MKVEDSVHIKRLTQPELVFSSPIPIAEPVPASVYIKSKTEICLRTSCGLGIVLSTENLPLTSFPRGLRTCCLLVLETSFHLFQLLLLLQVPGSLFCPSRLGEEPLTDALVVCK